MKYFKLKKIKNLMSSIKAIGRDIDGDLFLRINLIAVVFFLNLTICFIWATNNELYLIPYSLSLFLFVFFVFREKQYRKTISNPETGYVKVIKMNTKLFFGMPLYQLLAGPDYEVCKDGLPRIRTGVLTWLHLCIAIISKTKTHKSDLHQALIDTLNREGYEELIPWTVEIYSKISKNNFPPVPDDLSDL